MAMEASGSTAAADAAPASDEAVASAQPPTAAQAADNSTEAAKPGLVLHDSGLNQPLNAEAEGGQHYPKVPPAELADAAATPSSATQTSCYQSADYVRRNASRYRPVEDESASTVQLLMPNGEVERYVLSQPKQSQEYNPLLDVVGTIAVICSMEPRLTEGDAEFTSLLSRAQRRLEVASVKELVTVYNRRMSTVRAAGAFASPTVGPLSSSLAAHVWKQAYDRIVDDPESLNRYRSFSKEVYGETCHPLVAEVISKVGLKRRHLFVDFGMGIGNVVFQAAALTNCNVIGIELLDTPYRYAVRLLAELEARVAAYRVTIGRIRLLQGDFLQHPQLAALMNSIDVAFVNNYAFEAETNTALMQLFISLKNGARVVSFKAFAPPRQRLTEHNADNPSAILETVKHTYLKTDGVSWANTQIDYFIQTVDRTRLLAVQGRPPASAAGVKRSRRSEDDG